MKPAMARMTSSALSLDGSGESPPVMGTRIGTALGDRTEIGLTSDYFRSANESQAKAVVLCTTRSVVQSPIDCGDGGLDLAPCLSVLKMPNKYCDSLRGAPTRQRKR